MMINTKSHNWSKSRDQISVITFNTNETSIYDFSSSRSRTIEEEKADRV